MVQALTELAQGRSLVVFDASFEKALKESRVSTRRISPDPEADLATLPQKDPSALVAVSAQGLSPQLLAALLKTGAEVVLLTDDLRKLPEVSPEDGGFAPCWLFRIPPWPEGRHLAPLPPPSAPACRTRPGRRACGAVRWMAGTVWEGPVPGTLLAANRTGRCARPV